MARAEPTRVNARASETDAAECVAEIEPTLASLKARAETVAEIAANNAEEVDRDARFPKAALAAAQKQRLLGVMVPRELGGDGASLREVIDVCYRLAQGCSSTAMIFAMHQIMVACLLRHRRNTLWHADLLRRLCAEQLLLASSTTEGRSGGNVRSSEAPIERDGSRIKLERRATVISYGADADAIVTTARRSAEAPPSDQVLVAFVKRDYSLEPLVAWDTLGMRGTCSAGFTLKAAGASEQVLPDPYEKIHVQTMVPVAHLAWAGVWAGIAAGAVERARLFIRNAARQASGQLPPGAPHFTRATASLGTLRGLVATSLRRYEQISDDELSVASLEFQSTINLTKVEASELAVSTVMSALRACGLSGYRNDSQFTLGRHLRDVLSSPIMINNDRILANIGSASLMSAVPASFLD
ncbi:MAG: acyl-CoA/acyl-ACP dehydrogenase [Alphaproteobacteria bacterium]|nr:acyl-CoA/acyl-ACP dehydrogenase [Alphaproteobacteria bacterium]